MKNNCSHNLLKISKIQMGGGKIKLPIISLLTLVLILFLAVFLKGYHDGKHQKFCSPISVTSPAVEVSAALFHCRDSVNYYAERAFLSDDPKGCFVVGACYYLRKQGDLPDEIYTVSRSQADSFLMISAAQNYQPALDLIQCLQSEGCWHHDFPE